MPKISQRVSINVCCGSLRVVKRSRNIDVHPNSKRVRIVGFFQRSFKLTERNGDMSVFRKPSQLFEFLPWDSELFRLRVAIIPKNIRLTAERLPDLKRSLRAHEIDLLYYFRDTNSPQEVTSFAAFGFRFIDTRIILGRTLQRVKVPQEVPMFELRRQNELTIHLKPLFAMSKDLAKTSRFWSDPLVQRSHIIRMYRSWVEKSLSFERSDHFFWVGSAAQPLAFASFTKTKPHEATLSLIATRRDARRKGYGSALLKQSLYMLHKRGIRSVHLDMQLSNARALAFYQALGFRIRGSQYIFHWHR